MLEKKMGIKFCLTCPKALIECLSHARSGRMPRGTQMERILDFKEQPWVAGSLFRLLLQEFNLGPGPPEPSPQTQVNAEKVTAFFGCRPK